MMKTLAILSVLIIPVLLLGQNLGLGVIAGSPTGLSLKYVLGKQAALAAHAGWSFTGDQGAHLTGDYHYLFPMVIETAEGTSIRRILPTISYLLCVAVANAQSDCSSQNAGIGTRVELLGKKPEDIRNAAMAKRQISERLIVAGRVQSAGVQMDPHALPAPGYSHAIGSSQISKGSKGSRIAVADESRNCLTEYLRA